MTHRNTLFALTIIGFGIASTFSRAAAEVNYTRDVRPVLSEKCYICHGPAQQMSGLRLDSKQQRQAMAARGLESELVRRVTNKDAALQMPPWPAGLSISPAEIEILKSWAAEGANGDDPPPVDAAAANLLGAIDADDVARVRTILKDRRLLAARDLDGATPLMHAVLNARLDCVKLLLQHGANPNEGNYEGATALIWAVDDPAKVKLLLATGADVNAKTRHGSTALLAATLRYGSSDVVAQLLEHGASVNVTDTDNWTPMLKTAASGDTESMKQLLARGANPNAPAQSLTALTAAVWYGNLGSVQLLLAKGALVDGKDAFGFTPLSFAALWGRKEVSTELLEKGASVNLAITDTIGMRRAPGTPLMLASYAETQDVELVKLLLTRGADVHFSTSGGETAASRANEKGRSPVLAVLLEAGAKDPAIAAPGKPRLINPVPDIRMLDIREAVERSLVLLQRSDPAFISRTGCKSCHNQSLPAMALALAEERGFRLDRDAAKVQTAIVAQALNSQREKMLQMGDDEGPPLSGSYALVGLAAAGYPADATTAAFVRNIAARQLPAGNWHPAGARPPIEYSDVSTTAFAIRAIRLYGAGRRTQEYEARIDHARKWLLSIQPRYTDERVFQLLGLYWSRTNSAVLKNLAASLIKEQRPDGGWSQLTTLTSDAYATGMALYALNQTGNLSAGDALYQRGVKFLRETQMQDGSWLVESHAIPLQPPVDGTFPHGTNQFISAAGTSWAAMALMLTVPPQTR